MNIVEYIGLIELLFLNICFPSRNILSP